MLESALTFGPLLDTWSKSLIDWQALRSRSFTYLMMTTSLVSKDDLLNHYTALEDAFVDMVDPTDHYLGQRPSQLWSAVSVPDFVAAESVEAAVGTVEASLDLARFRDVMKAAVVSADGIEERYERRVESVTRTTHGFLVDGAASNGTPWSMPADAVVNCLWDGRYAIDREMGLPLPESWVYRLKYRVLGMLPLALKHIPSLTMVLGPYGDVVPMDGSSYLSWYPACRRGWSTAVSAPPEWEAACAGEVDDKTSRSVARDVYAALDRIVPGIAQTRTTAVDAGIVMSRGSTDIDKPDSQLHERFEIGVRGKDGYFSIDTGKFSCAPMFATHLVGQI